MAASVNGLGAGTQIPLANTFQPGQNSVRPEEQRKGQDNGISARGAEAASSQRTETGNQDILRALAAAKDDNGDIKAKRGSLVDIKI